MTASQPLSGDVDVTFTNLSIVPAPGTAMLLASAGLVGLPELLGDKHAYTDTFSVGLGFDGIAVALLSNWRMPVGINFSFSIGDDLKKMGLTIQWKTLGFDALLTGLRQDRWDLVIASHGITEERAKAVTFTSPHYCSGGAIVTKNPALKTANDLAGKVLAVQTGSSYLDAAQKIKGVKEVKNDIRLKR